MRIEALNPIRIIFDLRSMTSHDNRFLVPYLRIILYMLLVQVMG